jgi:hypothetical protein
MGSAYSFEQRRQALLKTKAGAADKVAMALAALPALIIVIPLLVFIDNVIIVKIIGTFVGVIIYVVVYSKIRKPIFKHYYKKKSGKFQL